MGFSGGTSGYKTHIAAVVLAVFTLAASLFFHAYWAAPEAQKMIVTLLFTKNIAVVGGLLALASLGAGRLSSQREGSRISDFCALGSACAHLTNQLPIGKVETPLILARASTVHAFGWVERVVSRHFDTLLFFIY